MPEENTGCVSSTPEVRTPQYAGHAVLCGPKVSGIEGFTICVCTKMYYDQAFMKKNMLMGDKKFSWHTYNIMQECLFPL